jgi:hypothetical protein
MEENQTMPRKVNFMTPSKMAKCYGVSLPTFFKWLKWGLDQDESIFLNCYARHWTTWTRWQPVLTPYYKCELRKISPDEVKTICKLLGDPECSLNFNKITIQSLAREAHVSLKTVYRVMKHYNWENEANPLDLTRKTRCLTPKSVKIIRNILGLEGQS